MRIIPPPPSSPATTAVMRGNKGRDTRPEVALRSALHRRGLRFRCGRAVLAGDVRVRPDIVFVTERVAIFVDGCYWHGCPEHGTLPRANSDYWRQKFERNLARDRRVNEALRRAGWRVVRIWEHVGRDDAVAAVEDALNDQRGMRKG